MSPELIAIIALGVSLAGVEVTIWDAGVAAGVREFQSADSVNRRHPGRRMCMVSDAPSEAF